MSDDVDVSRYLGSEESVTLVDECQRLQLAGRILLVLSLIAIGVFIGYAFYPNNTALKNIFELVKIGLLPLATLVVSFYFTKTDR